VTDHSSLDPLANIDDTTMTFFTLTWEQAFSTCRVPVTAGSIISFGGGEKKHVVNIDLDYKNK
jgi:hypothetical protein